MAGLSLLMVATTVYLGRRSLHGRLVIVAVLAWTLAVTAVLSRALDRPRVSSCVSAPESSLSWEPASSVAS